MSEYDDDYEEDFSFDDEDDLNMEEAGFVEGYSNYSNKKTCENCDNEIDDFEDPIVREHQGKILYFCSEKCLHEFEEDAGKLDEEE